MQLARQSKISLEEDSVATNAITIKIGYFDGNKDSCNATHGDDTTSNEDTLFKKEDSFDADDCMSTITFTDEYLLLGSKPHNRPLFMAGYAHEQKYYIENAKKEKEVLPSKELKSYNSLSIKKNDSSAIEAELSKEEGGHKTVAIDEKGFNPEAFRLLVKAGYNPKEKLSLEKLPPKATNKKLHRLNDTQVMLKEKGHAIQNSRVDLGFTPPKPIRIAIKRARSN
ncbi:UNVERIFIED_CONTAM: hypothetical protein Scaly_0686600 [Sesamum calycinum]|uniref:Uncharacterized protein n=1 Tax=Sesamum calycinum TaxID=2727403 RepID=A0AAW2R6D0_9LAMI